MIKRQINSLLLSVFFVLPLHAQQINVELRGEYEQWNMGTNLGGKASSTLAGASVGYYKDAYFAGAGFALGNYEISNDTDKEIQRTDFDLVLGKKLDDQWSVFTGYRFNRFDFTSKSNASLEKHENTLGLGIGAMFNVPFTPRIIGFVSGAINGVYSYNNFDEKGNGISVGSDVGVVYSVNPKTTIAARIKYQTTKISYDDAPDWSHAYNRFGLNLGYLY